MGQGFMQFWEITVRLPITEVDDCNIADVLIITQIYDVKPKPKHNKEQRLIQYSSRPNNTKPCIACCFLS
jgi:hypothetical protein